MWKAIIIDDEKLIREGLVTYIDWASLGVEICATCRDGVEGMKAILYHHPDFVLSDISMPNMDGITLLKQVKLHGIPCEFIFISAYSDFEYAKNAVTYGAFDYLLKPLEAGPLQESVQRLIQKLASHKTPTPIVGYGDIQKMFLHLLTTMPQSESAFAGMLQYYGVPSIDKAWLLVLDTENPDAVKSMIDAVPKPPTYFHVAVFASLQVFLLCFNQDSTQYLERFQKELEAIQCRFSFAPCEGGMICAFEQAQHALLTIHYPFQTAAVESDFLKGFALSPLVIRQADSQSIFIALSFLWHRLQKETMEDIPLNSKMIMFFEKCYGQLENQHGSPLAGCDEKYKYLNRLRSTTCLYERFILLHKLIEELLQQCRSQSGGHPYTRQAIKIIRERYSENLSLQQVAQEIRISKSHLSSVFKADTGVTFSDYLFSYRMQIAQTLLKQQKHKIYEVGAMVGYPDIVQFSKRFKEHFQVAPKQWQSNHYHPD